MPDTHKLQIAMLELSDQNRAVLEFYFASTGTDLYTVVSKELAEAYIIDYDLPNAEAQLETQLKTAAKPTIILSDKSHNIPSTLWLAKPLTVDALNEAADSLKTMIAQPTEVLANDHHHKIESDEEIDDLLHSLTSDSSQQHSNNADSDDIFIDSLELNEAIETNQNHDFEFTRPLDNTSRASRIGAQIENVVVEKSLTEEIDAFELLNENSPEEVIDEVLLPPTQTHSKTTEIESSESQNIELDEITLLDESITIETEKDVSLITEEKSSLLLDDLLNDNHVRIEDEAAASEDSFVQPLEVDFSAIKADESSRIMQSPETMDFDDLASSEKLEAFELEAPEETIALRGEELSKSEFSDTGFSDTEFSDNEFNHNDFIDTDTSNVSTNNEQVLQKNNGFDLDLELLEPEPKEKPSVLIDDTTSDDALTKDISSNKQAPETLANNSKLEMGSDLDNLLAEVSEANGDFDTTNNLDASSFKTEILETDNAEENTVNKANIHAQEIASLKGITEPQITQIEKPAQTVDIDNDLSDNELQSLLNQVREEADDLDDDNTDDATGLGKNNTKDEKRWIQLCGNNKRIESQKEVAKLSYQLNKHLLGSLLNELEKNKGSDQLYRLKYHDLIIVIDQTQDTIYCNLAANDEELSEICFSEIDSKKIKVYDLDYSEIRLYKNEMKSMPQNTYSIESFLWLISLLTSRGRLPEKTDLTKKFSLKVWPNLTRHELPPHSVQIAAVMSKHSGNLLEFSQWINIEQRFIFAFYNASFILGMIESDSKKLKKPSFSFKKKEAKIKSNEKGVFGRLIKKLKA